MRSSGTTTVRLLSRGRRLLAVFLALSFGAAFVAAVPLPAAAAACDAPVINEVACENTKTGNPSTEWNITGSGTNDTIDPTTAWTGTWRDPRFSPPKDGGRPENALTGTLFTVNCCTTDMEVDGTDGQLRFWRNTRVATLTANQITTLGSGILGYEWDESPDDSSRPRGLIHLSTTDRDVSSYVQDYGSTYNGGSATHHLTTYRAASGALVFGAGTVQWAWGLDNNHSGGGSATSDTAVKQATVNLFADMGMQPSTIQSGLTVATASGDTTPPTSTILTPAAGASLTAGQPITITGTASDTGGKVGAVEVSVDNGTPGGWPRAEPAGRTPGPRARTARSRSRPVPPTTARGPRPPQRGGPSRWGRGRRHHRVPARAASGRGR